MKALEHTLKLYHATSIKNLEAIKNEGLKRGCPSNFNGMNISGNGKVTIGNHFHSGKRIRIITSFHNYEGEMIPYDHTYIDKDVSIGDNVWLGEGVTILGGLQLVKEQ